METTRYPVSPVLTIEVRTTSRAVASLLRTKFGGLYTGEPSEDTHLVLRLVERDELALKEKLVVREITIPELCVFDDEDFFIVRGGKRISIPFSDLGRESEITVEFEKGFPPDWIRRLVDDLLAFHAVGFGLSLVHAACLDNEDFELIIPAWRGTGKTHLALRQMLYQEYGYKAEDQFFMDSNGNSYVYTDACHVDPKHMASFPEIRDKYRSPSYYARTRVAKILLPMLPPINAAFEFARRVVLKLFHPKVFVKMGEFIPGFHVSHRQNQSGAVMQIITRPDISSASIELQSNTYMANSALGGMQYERIDLYPYYFAWVYAMGRRNAVIDDLPYLELSILESGFESRDCYKVAIPVGCDWDENQEILDRVLPRRS